MEGCRREGGKEEGGREGGGREGGKDGSSAGGCGSGGGGAGRGAGRTHGLLTLFSHSARSTSGKLTWGGQGGALSPEGTPGTPGDTAPPSPVPQFPHNLPSRDATPPNFSPQKRGSRVGKGGSDPPNTAGRGGTAPPGLPHPRAGRKRPPLPRGPVSHGTAGRPGRDRGCPRCGQRRAATPPRARRGLGGGGDPGTGGPARSLVPLGASPGCSGGSPGVSSGVCGAAEKGPAPGPCGMRGQPGRASGSPLMVTAPDALRDSGGFQEAAGGARGWGGSPGVPKRSRERGPAREPQGSAGSHREGAALPKPHRAGCGARIPGFPRSPSRGR